MEQYTINGIIYTTTQDPYLDSDGENNWYTAQAIGPDDSEHTLTWQILDTFDVRTDSDESEACDWNNPKLD